MIFMIGYGMRDTERDELTAVMTQPVCSRTGVWAQQPTKMYLRLWPVANYNQSYQAMFRYTQYGVPVEHAVQIHQRKGSLPLTSAQYTVWDQIRTEFALEPPGFDAKIYIGMTLLPDSLVSAGNAWDQSHIFFIVVDRDTRQYRTVISHHFDSITYSGRWKQASTYQDWIMNDQKIIQLT
jgi:hypothetical protein